MSKKFNITGTCIPEHHFMADISGKIDSILQLIFDGDYLTINRPRQYGKTTVFYLLEKRLQKNDAYLPINISLEGIDTPTYDNHQIFIATVLELLAQQPAI